MPDDSLREALQNGRVLLGLGNMYPAPGIIEGMCRGWGFVWIDGQHGQMPYDAILGAIRAAAVVGTPTLVRSPGHDPGTLGLIADLAPGAIMVPLVNTVTQARGVAEALHFPPRGNRSYGGRRAIDLAGRAYYRLPPPLAVAQIETPAAVEEAAGIAAVDGVDGLFFGPDDMKIHLGLPIDTPPHEHPVLRGLMQQTAEAARSRGRFAGCVAPSAAAVRVAIEMGYQLIVVGGDRGFLSAGAQAKWAEVRHLAEPRASGSAGPTPRAGIY